MASILPGEEQVTTRDTLERLSPAERAALQKKYETGGHAQTMGYDDWLSENFGDLPPQEREQTMRGSAVATPRINIGKDTTLPAGMNSDLAKSRTAAGKPLPEGREASQYTPDQQRTMQRNVFAPERPMTRFGGTFTHRPSGAVSMRAVNPELLVQADAIAKDQGQYSPSHIAALAMAYNIDAQKYGDDLDLLRADVMAEKEIHDRMMAANDIVPNEMGGFRYAPNAASKAAAETRDRARMAKDIGRRYESVMSPQDYAELETFAATPDGRAKMQALAARLDRMRSARIASNVADRKDNFNLTRDLNNPAMSRGMAIRSLLAEADNPQRMAAVQSAFGDQRGADRSTQLAMQQQQIAGQLAAADAEARAAGQPKPTMADELKAQLTTALATEDPAQRFEAVRTVLAMNPANEGRGDIDQQATTIIAGHLARTDPQNPAVQMHLQSLRANKPAFVQFVTTQMGIDDPAEVERMYQQANPSWTPRSVGAAVGRVPGNVASAVSGFFGGMIGGE